MSTLFLLLVLLVARFGLLGLLGLLRLLLDLLLGLLLVMLLLLSSHLSVPKVHLVQVWRTRHEWARLAIGTCVQLARWVEPLTILSGETRLCLLQAHNHGHAGQESLPWGLDHAHGRASWCKLGHHGQLGGAESGKLLGTLQELRVLLREGLWVHCHARHGDLAIHVELRQSIGLHLGRHGQVGHL